MAQEKKNNGKNIPAMIIRGGTSKGAVSYTHLRAHET